MYGAVVIAMLVAPLTGVWLDTVGPVVSEPLVRKVLVTEV